MRKNTFFFAFVLIVAAFAAHLFFRSLNPQIPYGADLETSISLKPGLKIVYWAQEPANRGLELVTNWSAAHLYKNVGISVANKFGKATILVPRPHLTSEQVIHYRIFGNSGSVGPLHSFVMNIVEYFGNPQPFKKLSVHPSRSPSLVNTSVVVVTPTGGLCNKLRVVFSYYKLAKHRNLPLVVIWETGKECNGFFLDYFQAVPGITFERSNSNNRTIDYRGCRTHKDYFPDYDELQLMPYMTSKIQNKIRVLGSQYIAVHVRRTDHVELAKKRNQYTGDEEFYKFIDAYPQCNLYIATDNKQTYDEFRNKYNRRVKLPYNENVDDLRQTSLEDSILDLYMCMHSYKFKGSGWSSFSELIDLKRVENLEKYSCTSS